MTSESTFPSTLRNQDVERGSAAALSRVPIRLVPPHKDEDDDETTNVVKAKLDKEGETYETVKKHSGSGSHEGTILFIQTVMHLFDSNGYKEAIDMCRALT